MVALLYHVPRDLTPDADPLAAQVCATFETEESIARLVAHIRYHGTDLVPVNAADDDWPDLVAHRRVFNYTYGFGLLADSVRPTLILEAADADYIGAPPAGLYLSANKPHSAELMQAAGFRCPRQRLVCAPVGPAAAARLCGHFDGCPHLVLKPAYEGSSVGLAVTPNEPAAVEAAVADLFALLPGPVLVQEYVDGTDVTVPLVGRKEVRCLPAVALIRDYPRPGPFVLDTQHKQSILDGHYAALGDWPRDLRETVYDMARRAWQLTGQRDWARLDCRVTPDGRCYFLEVNANPRLGLDRVAFAVSAAAVGMAVGDVFRVILRDEPLPYGPCPVAAGL